MEIVRTDEYEDWFRTLRDHRARNRINARLTLCATAGKPVGDLHPVSDGVSELRFDLGPGYRVYFAQKADRIMLLLAGGNKTGQSKDIDTARKLLRELIREGQW